MKFSLIIIYFLSFISFPIISYAQKDLKITGYAPKLKDGTAVFLLPSYPNRYLKKQASDRSVIRKNPIVVRNGKFSSTILVRNGDTYVLEIQGVKGVKTICLAPGELTISMPGLSLDSVIFEGNETTNSYDNFFKKYYGSSFYKNASRARIEARFTTDTAKLNAISKLLDSNGNFYRSMASNHFQKFPNSFINSIILNSSFSEVQRKEIFQSFSKSTTNNSFGDNLRFEIDSLFVGGYAPTFTQNDTLGKPISLSKYRGKYVLIDFWASWCIPCRAENPALVDAISKYSTKNFTIVSVSLDDNKTAWLDAIKTDGLNWDHISDLKKYNNSVSVNYGVYSVPANFLIDPNGKIMSKNLRGKEVLQALEKIYN